MLQITFIGRDDAGKDVAFRHIVHPAASTSLIEFDGPGFTVTKISITDDGYPMFERHDAPEPVDIGEALTVLTDFVHHHMSCESPDSEPPYSGPEVET